MSLDRKIRFCTHIKVNGVSCGSPTLRGEVFCYFHQRLIRGVATPPKSRLHPIAILEGPESIQVSLMEITNALVRNTIDLRRAQLILRALNIAFRNARHARFRPLSSDLVSEVPDYPAAPAPPNLALVQAGSLAQIHKSQNVSESEAGEVRRQLEREQFDDAFASALSATTQPRPAASKQDAPADPAFPHTRPA